MPTACSPAFWGLNIGLAMMVFMSLLPAGHLPGLGERHARASGIARSPEIVHSPVMDTLVWLRVPGDIVFALGCLLLAVYAFRLLRRPPRVEPRAQEALQPS